MLSIGPWIFDPASRRLVAGRKERRLSPKSAGVLLALAETPHHVWSRDALLERVWPQVHVGEEVLTHAIAELRKALGDDFRKPVFVETVHKSGYRLVCAVERIAPEGSAAPPGEPLPRRTGGAFASLGTNFDLSAYCAYLEGQQLFERGGRANTARAAARFGEAIAAEPGFALAHVGHAKSLAFLAVYYAPSRAGLDDARRHIDTALRIDPDCAEALAADGIIHALHGDFPGALSRFKASILRDPQSSETHYLLGRACFAEFNVALAAPMFERAAALRPDDYHSLILAGKARQMTGDRERAHADFALAYRRIGPRLAADPADYRGWCGLARCLVHLGRDEQAYSLVDRMRGHPDPMDYYLACTLARAGDTDRALDTLEQVVDEGWNHRAWLDRDPDFDRLRQHARFRRIAGTIGAG
jgi:DNA-binding winged helix-turn-helix (wHTH) protein/Flp pilus assembly protein TadD